MISPTATKPLMMTHEQMIAAVTARAIEGSVPYSGSSESVITFETPSGVVAPAFQLDANGQALVFVQETNKRLGANSDPLGAYSWWSQPNAWIQKAPKELVGTSQDHKITYALDQIVSDDY